MTWWIWILVFLVTVLEPWPVTVEGISGFGWEPVTVSGIRGVILPARDAGSLVHGTRPELSEGDYVTPVMAEIEV
ncbi:MAG: hypothetical protein H0W23_07135, partial [Chloroflexia bacterium]|nr:hypothetical protein [Chloroflexia bacterium]